MLRRIALLSVVLVLSGLFGQPIVAADKADDQAKEAVEQFAKALVGKDVDGLMKVVDVPWCMEGKRLIKDRDELKKEFIKLLDAKDFSKDKVAIKLVAPLPKFEEAVGKKLPDDHRKMFEEVLGKDHRMVLIEVEQGERKGKGVIAVRLQDGKARVVGIVD